jgi:hypothetical protein
MSTTNKVTELSSHLFHLLFVYRLKKVREGMLEAPNSSGYLVLFLSFDVKFVKTYQKKKRLRNSALFTQFGGPFW